MKVFTYIVKGSFVQFLAFLVKQCCKSANIIVFLKIQLQNKTEEQYPKPAELWNNAPNFSLASISLFKVFLHTSEMFFPILFAILCMPWYTTANYMAGTFID